MKTSRDLALIAMFAAISFVFNVLIGQLPGLITGLAGMAYVFTIVYSIIQSVAYLMYGGRRWRILAQALLLSLLYFLVTAYFLLLVTAMLPVIIVEAVAGSFIGYKIFGRVEKISG
jgi:riboflavin transporter FmnP